MGKKFFNGKYTILFNDNVDLNLNEKFELHFGNLYESYLKIKMTEIDTEFVYNGHLIINTSSTDLIKRLNFESIIDSFPLTDSNIYLPRIVHTGANDQCSASDEIVFCSTWVLPFYFNLNRSNNSLYSNMIRHRIYMQPLTLNQTHFNI
jgi:hypothetical protein